MVDIADWMGVHPPGYRRALSADPSRHIVPAYRPSDLIERIHMGPQLAHEVEAALSEDSDAHARGF
jgi:hypothetical protein